MPRVFNTTAVCIPEKHYMVNLDSRLQEIRQLVDEGKYFNSETHLKLLVENICYKNAENYLNI